MDRFKKLFAIMIIMLIPLTLTSCIESNVKYPDGRDTVKSFGDGTYQFSYTDDKKYLILINVAVPTSIDDKVINYELIKDKLYVYGGIGYTILDCETNMVRQYLTFEGYTENEKKQYKICEDVNDKNIGKIIKLKKFEDFSKKERIILKNLKYLKYLSN
ncbi:MAG: hypothetical protein Q8880_11575 [Bacteroidota bacterium]|nr:hypothetical protein [Bacteroidota bacterium]